MQRFITSRPSARPLILLGALLASCAIAFASPRSDAWKLRRTNPAEAARQLEAVVANDPRDAKAYWFLALLYNDQNRGAEGLAALENARRADPALSFAEANSIANVERALRRDAARSGGTSTSNSNSPAIPYGGGTRTQGAGMGNQQEIAQALQTTGVYVSPGMASQADANALTQAVRQHPGSKVIVLDSPPDERPLNVVAKALHTNLNMGSGLLVMATGSPRLIETYGGGLVKSRAQLDAIEKANVATFNAQGYTQGIIGILNQHAAEESSTSRGANTFLLFLIGVPAGAGFLLWKRAQKGRAERQEQLRVETRDIANELAPAYEKLDSEFEFAIVAQTDPAKQKQLREARAQAGEAFSNAMKQLNGATDAASLAQARSSLLYARDSIENANAVLEGRPAPNVASNSQLVGAPSGGQMMQSGMSGGGYDQDFDVAPLGTSYPGARPGYALDFFTSEPTPIVDMVPVEINVNGQRQRVWASRDSAQRALSGQPQVATVNYGGQMVPWYNAPQQYNPWSGFGTSVVQMVAMNAVLNSVFHSGHDVHHYHHYNGPDYSGGGYGGGGYDAGGYNAPVAQDDGGVTSLDLFGGGSGNSGAVYDNSNSSSLDLFGGGGGSSWSSDSS